MDMSAPLLPPPSPLLNDTELSDVEALFNYDPSQGAAIALTAVFFVLALLQFYLFWKHRPDGYMLVIAFTALIGESLGYGTRIVAIHFPSDGVYIITLLLILLSPCATALVNYIVCGRVLAFTGQNVGCLRPHWIAKAFLLSDVVTFLIQGMGGALTSNSDTASLGKSIVTIGLALQLASFGLFVYVALSIQFMQRFGFRDNSSAQKVFYAMHATMLCFIVRSVFRLIEFNGGEDGYASTHEWTAYVFDAAVMVIAFSIYSWPPLHFGYNLNMLAAERSGLEFDAVGKQAPAVASRTPGQARQAWPVTIAMTANNANQV